MPSPSPSASASVTARALPPAPTEMVERPPPGLARGKWEASPAFFWIVGAVVVFGVAVYVLARRGAFGKLRARLAKSLGGGS